MKKIIFLIVAIIGFCSMTIAQNCSVKVEINGHCQPNPIGTQPYLDIYVVAIENGGDYCDWGVCQYYTGFPAKATATFACPNLGTFCPYDWVYIRVQMIQDGSVICEDIVLAQFVNGNVYQVFLQ